MATTSIPHRWKYDVFVSFRGEDIRKGFMDHMFNDFDQKGIHAFRDDTKLPKGEEISPHLYKAIEESRFLLVIFSKNYASSTWCLRELVKILDCKQMGELKHEVLIIFYDVKPDVVRRQTESYAEAFAKHQDLNSPEVAKWKEALSMAANLSGWDLQDMTNGYEYKFIDRISKHILIKLRDGPLDVGANLVGIDIHLDKLDLSRFIGSDKVNMIGICGISGIGKTTLAKAIYNMMYVHFEGSCFCEDVKDVKEAQMQMIRKILKTNDLRISNVGEGIMVIKKRMVCKRILLVLDDVNNLEQLEALAGSCDWFFPGSLIIFTSKDKQLLRSHDVEIYEMESLDYNEALELLSLNAFGERHPIEDFKEFASKIVKYLHGHPLALKVIGRLLRKKPVEVWEGELKRLQTFPNSDILQKLRPSFDGLASDQKRMFLDIACALIGENKDIAASVLHNSHCFANAIIEVLADKFLITVSKDCLQMHELIQSMAREIVREEFRMPGNHSRRLWISSEDDKDDILNENKVAEEVEVLALLLKKNCQNIPIDGQALTCMKNLRILKICFPKVKGRWQPFAVNFSGRLDLLSNKLRLLYWHGLPLESLPSDFYPENIVAIDLSYSHIKQLWTTPKCLRRLKIMKLRYCYNLTTTPDFSETTNLGELDLEGCVNLATVHPSIEMLNKLAVLNLKNCPRVGSFPEAFWSRCWTSISGFMWNQRHPHRSVSLAGLHMLKSLNLSYCNLVQVPESIGGLSCLKNLELDGNDFTSLPGFFSQFSHLQRLKLNGCKKLEVLPKLPPSLRVIDASHCTSLREVSIPSNCILKNLEELSLEGCVSLSTLHPSIVMPKKLVVLNLKDCSRVWSFFGNLYYFYPENIVAIDLSYSNIKQLWTTPKCFRRLKVMKLRYCCDLTTTPDFSDITNLEELDLEGCVNLVTVHPSIGMLNKLAVLNLKDCTRVGSFPEAFWSRWSRCWTSISGFVWNQQHPQRSVSLAGLHMLKSLNLSYCNLLEVPESIGGLSYLEELYLSGNNFTSFSGSLSQLSNLKYLHVDGCKKLEVLPELPPSLRGINASDCTSLREVPGSSKASQI